MANFNDPAPWQEYTDTTTSMLKSLFLTEDFCDVTFRVEADGKCDHINAHSVLLSARSAVFATMFYGSLPQRNTVVEVTDIKPSIFRLMIKFIYTDDTSKVDQTNFAEIYKAAHKYQIISLKRVCATAIETYISMEKIGEFLTLKELYEDPVIDGKCDKYIEKNAWRLFQKEAYYKDLSREHLLYIWSQDKEPDMRFGVLTPSFTRLPETAIFRGAVTWAKAECERQGMSPEIPENQREVLGDAMDLICFPRMSLKEFYEVTKESSLLTWKEVADMAFYMGNATGENVPFGKPFHGKVSSSAEKNMESNRFGRVVGGRSTFVPEEEVIASTRFGRFGTGRRAEDVRFGAGRRTEDVRMSY